MGAAIDGPMFPKTPKIEKMARKINPVRTCDFSETLGVELAEKYHLKPQ